MKIRFFMLWLLLAVMAAGLYTSAGCGSGGDPNDDPVFAVSQDGDFDHDGIPNSQDDDDDNDGVPDNEDAFPFDSGENSDLDGDGIGNNTDTDADGDGVDKTSDCDDLNASIFPNNADEPDSTGTDSNCDGLDGDLDNALWVASDGNDSNSGAIDEPLGSISKAIDISDGKDVYVAAGTYIEDVELKNGVSIYGGFGLLEEGLRKHDVQSFVSTIIGVDNGKSQGLVLNGTTFTIHATVLAKATDSTLSGFTIIGDGTIMPNGGGVAVISYNSSINVAGCKIYEASPSAVKMVNAGVVVSADGAATDTSATTITNSEIEMKGVASKTSGRDFGIAVLPADGAVKDISLTVTGSKITAYGDAEAAFGIHAATDASAKLDMDIEKNTISMYGGSELLIGIGAGSLMADPVIPTDSVYVNTLKAIENTIDIKIGTTGSVSQAFGIAVEQALGAVALEKNIVRASLKDGGAAILLSLVNSAVDATGNVLEFSGTAKTVNAVVYGTYNLFLTEPGVPANTIGIFNGNTFDLACVENGKTCTFLGFIENSGLGFNASPKEFKNNVFDFDVGSGVTLWVYYRDSLPLNVPSSSLIDDIAAMNDRSDLLDPVNDPTVFEGNTAK